MVSSIQSCPSLPSRGVENVRPLDRAASSPVLVRIEEMVSHVVKSCKAKKEVIAAIERFVKPLSLQVLEEAVLSSAPNYQGVLAEVENLSKEAAWYYSMVQGPPKACTPGLASSLIHSFFVSLESFLRGLGLTDFFRPVIGEYDVELKGQKMVLLSTFFSTLTATLIPLLGAAYGGAAIFGIMASLAGLSISYPLWRPIPSYLPKVENWTEKYVQGALQVKRVKTSVIDEIVSALHATKRDHLQVLLVGKDGVGKTEILKALVAALARGDYPEFRSAQVFYVNTADLLSHTEWVPKRDSTLSFFSDALEGHRDEVIFVFDQIHLAYQSDTKIFLGDQLKAMFDREKDFFPHVIGITTEKECKDLLESHPGFVHRFRHIKIDEPSDKETILALHQTLLKTAPETILQSSTLETLIVKAKEAFGKDAVMPKTALRILSKCLAKVSKEQRIPLEIEVEKLERELNQLRREKIFDRDKDLSSSEKSLAEKRLLLSVQKKEIDTVFAMRKLLLEMKETMYKIALKMPPKGTDSQQKAFLMFSHFLLPALENELLEKARHLNVKIVIDSDLINQVISEELYRS